MTDQKCQECGIGHYRPINAPYLTRLGKRMLVMPDAPAYVCDVCGYRCFDEVFLISIQHLIRQMVEGPRRRGQRRQRPAGETAVWSEARRSR